MLTSLSPGIELQAAAAVEAAADRRGAGVMPSGGLQR